MHWLTLPPPETAGTPAFTDPLNAKIWLADQPQAQPMLMLGALARQVAAIDGAPLLAQEAIAVLNVLRAAAIPLQAAVEARFLRKALPPNDGERQAFEAIRNLWWKLAMAYFRRASQLKPEAQLLPLHRAAIALRMVEYCHLQAAFEIPPQVDRLLFGVLAQAQNSGILLSPLADSDFPNFGEAHIAGHLAWTILLRLIEPYSLSATQLTVANRALSRWREFCEFRDKPSSDPKAHTIDLAPFFGEDEFPADLPRWIEVRKVRHKIAGRIKALHDGETPESLKLGRELSATACMRLLKQMDRSLSAQARQSSTEVGEIDLTFGAENAYVLLKGEPLKKPERFNATSSQISHQRFEIFGFDQISHTPEGVKKLDVPSEPWTLIDGYAVRRPDRQGEKRLAPCLIAAKRQGKAMLGIMRGLRLSQNAALTADLDWFAERVEAAYINSKGGVQEAVRIPVFLLRDPENMSLIAPSGSAIRLNENLFLTGIAIGRVMIDAILEQGSDFTHYSVRK